MVIYYIIVVLLEGYRTRGSMLTRVVAVPEKPMRHQSMGFPITQEDVTSLQGFSLRKWAHNLYEDPQPFQASSLSGPGTIGQSGPEPQVLKAQVCPSSTHTFSPKVTQRYASHQQNT